MKGKKSSKEAIKAVEKLAETKNKLLRGQLKDHADAVQKAIDLASKPALSEAFKSLEDFKKFQGDISRITKIGDMAKTLSGFEDYLKPNYGYVAKATEQLKTMQQALGLPESTLDMHKNMSKTLKDMYDPLGYAAKLSKTATALNQSGLIKVMKEQEERQKKLMKSISAPIFSDKPKELDFPDINRNFMEEEQRRAKKAAKKEKREETLLTNSKTQIEKLDLIATYMIQQSENLELQNEILGQQVENLRLQNEKAEQQIQEIREQNKIMKVQQEENKNTSRIALGAAIGSIVIGIIVSYLIYYYQDISDNKNHTELLQVIKESSKKEELSPLFQQQFESSKKTNQLLNELIKKSFSKTATPQKKGSE